MMKNKFTGIIAFVIFFLTASYITFAHSDMFSPGEDLFYEVSYMGVKLGSIRLVTKNEQVMSGHQTIQTIAYIDSYKGIPFVDIHAIFNSWIDTSATCSYKFVGKKKQSDDWFYEEVNFDYPSRSVKVAQWKNKVSMYNKSMKMKQGKSYVDGLAIFYFARHLTSLKKNTSIQCIVDDDTVKVNLNAQTHKENIEIDAISEPVRTNYLSGQFFGKGFYGLNGKFEGWFSDDNACIPIKAKLNVYLGSININLVRWKRSGWTPPK